MVDARRLLEVDARRRAAERDRAAAVRALEARSAEFNREKAAKRALEARIGELETMTMGAGAGAGAPRAPARSAADYDARLVGRRAEARTRRTPVLGSVGE